MKRRCNEPDNRLDWRDPNMPVLRVVEYTNPMGGKPQIVLEEFTPEDERKYAESVMARENPTAPNWKDDPTYSLGKPKRRRR